MDTSRNPGDSSTDFFTPFSFIGHSAEEKVGKKICNIYNAYFPISSTGILMCKLILKQNTSWGLVSGVPQPVLCLSYMTVLSDTHLITEEKLWTQNRYHQKGSFSISSCWVCSSKTNITHVVRRKGGKSTLQIDSVLPF